MIVTLLSWRPGTLEATSWAIPRTELGSRIEVPDSSTAAEAALWPSPKIWFWALGQHELDLRPGDALHAVDRRFELALQRALVGHLLLEVAFAEALFVEQFPARLGVPEQPGAGQRDARLGGLVVLHRDRRAVVLQLVADAVRAERARHLACLRRIHAAHQQRVARRRDHVQEQVDEEDPGDRGAADDEPAARCQPGRECSDVRHRSDLCVEDRLGGFRGLGADLGGELHLERRVLDGRDRRLGVADRAGGERLGGGGRRSPGPSPARRSLPSGRCRSWACRRLPAAAPSVPAGLREAAFRAGGGDRRFAGLPAGDVGAGVAKRAGEASDRGHDHFSRPSVEVNIDFEVCIAVTFAW